jgi:LCP family protein required for cell wall assembly
LAGWFAYTLYWRQIEQRGAVNVLVLGVDERPQEDPPFRSDTMILTGFNPTRREVAVMSIPRDLWITLPDGNPNRINTAHFFGGPEWAKETVRSNFGVPLAYYVRLNFDGFVSIIDAMGGVPIDVPERLYDENYPTADYGVTTIDIPAGEQVMDGATALIYARSRYSTSDFDRGRRQQEIIAAIQRQLLNPSTWGRYPAVFAAAQSAITTDIPQGEWPALTLILLRSEVHRVAIEHEDTQDFVTDVGAQVLLPVWEAINPKLARYFE